MLLVVVLLLVSCGQSRPQPASSPSPGAATPTAVSQPQPEPAATVTLPPALTPTPLPAGEPDEAVLALNELLDEEGRLPLETALEIFAAHAGPLPGVTPRALPGANAGRAAEAAVFVVAARLPSLPPEVAAAVEDALFGDIEEWAEIPPSGQGRGGSGALDQLADWLAPPARATEDLEGLEQVISEVRERIEARAGVQLNVPVRVAVARRLDRTGPAAYAAPVYRGRTMAACRIVFQPDVAGDSIQREFVAAHELWHCFQWQHSPRDRGGWVDEGQADWVASVIASDPSPAAERWDTWLGTPHASLWGRSYDAIGIYAAAEAAGHDPFGVLLQMYELGNQEAVSALFGGMAFEEALRLVAMTLARAPAFGPEWESTGRGITGTRAAPSLSVSPPGRSVEIDAGAFGSLPIDLTISGLGEDDVLRIRVYEPVTVGAVEFEDGTVFDLAGGQVLWFCVPGGVCTCEDGSSPVGQEIPPLPASRAVLTVATVRTNTVGVEMTYAALEELCGRLVGEWTASAEDILAANTAPYGGLPPGLSCDGTILLTFLADGTFRRTWEAECEFHDSRGSGTGLSEGRYEDHGDRVTFLDVRTTGSVTAGGMNLGNFFDATPSGEASYLIQGDRLTFRFSTADGATIEQHYTRVR